MNRKEISNYVEKILAKNKVFFGQVYIREAFELFLVEKQRKPSKPWLQNLRREIQLKAHYLSRYCRIGLQFPVVLRSPIRVCRRIRPYPLYKELVLKYLEQKAYEFPGEEND
jgi:hypothetical protein